MLKCRNCGLEIAENQTFCSNCGLKVIAEMSCEQCGANILEGEKFCGKCGGKTKEQKARKCSRCGLEYSDSEKFCSGCGNNLHGESSIAENGIRQADVQDINENKIMAILAYLGILVLAPLLSRPNSKFARFHANQGLLICLLAVSYGFLQMLLSILFYSISWSIGIMMSTVMACGSIVFIVLVIIGIINVVNGEMKELPIIGKYRLIKL